jgi:acetylornithine deacetylase/succinyl-diaminopimelate desuccinylase-like protein
LAVFAQAALDIAREVKAGRVKLARDLIVLAEADEEGGAYGTSYLAAKAWDKIDCEFALNEGGWIIRDEKTNKVQYVSISTADKSSLTLTLRARGTSTHSSMPLADNAIFRLARALEKISRYDTRPRLNASTRQFFATLAATSEEPMKSHFHNLVEAKDPALVAAADRAISQNPLWHAIMRNTIAPVFLNAGFRGNVIPGSADATLNFRVIPGTTAAELIDEMKTVIADPAVEVRESARTSAGLAAPVAARTPVPESSQDTELYRALAKHAKLTYPEALVTPYLFQAGTDAGAWRSRGVPVYGIYPYPITKTDLERMHGNDERVPVASLVSGVRMMTGTLLEVCAKR